MPPTRIWPQRSRPPTCLAPSQSHATIANNRKKTTAIKKWVQSCSTQRLCYRFNYSLRRSWKSVNLTSLPLSSKATKGRKSPWISPKRVCLSKSLKMRRMRRVWIPIVSLKVRRPAWAPRRDPSERSLPTTSLMSLNTTVSALFRRKRSSLFSSTP